MVEDIQTRIKKDVRKRLENLDFVRKQSYSEIIDLLVTFYENNKEAFKKWQEQKNKKTTKK